MSPVKPIPDGYHSVTPYLVIRGADRAIDFYKRAFGAQVLVRMEGPGGVIGHAELKIGDSMIMLGEENPARGARSPAALNGTPVGILLYVEDVDAASRQAVEAGAKVLMPVQDMFWGDRYGKFADPFGHEWSIATHKEDLTGEEIGKRAATAFAQSAGA